MKYALEKIGLGGGTKLLEERVAETHIRRAGLDDVETMVQFRYRMFEDMGVSKSEEEIARFMEANRRYFSTAIPAETFLGWVAVSEETGESVATGGMSFFQRAPNFTSLDGREGYLLNMYTLPEWRQQGIAKGIVSAILEHARSIGIAVVRLHASSKGRPVYEKLGFIDAMSEMTLKF